LYNDLFTKYTRFFDNEALKDVRFLFDITTGFLPRRFENSDDDKIIYDEDQEVAEMYFITDGFVGIGFSLFSNGITRQQTIMSQQ